MGVSVLPVPMVNRFLGELHVSVSTMRTVIQVSLFPVPTAFLTSHYYRFQSGHGSVVLSDTRYIIQKLRSSVRMS